MLADRAGIKITKPRPRSCQISAKRATARRPGPTSARSTKRLPGPSGSIMSASCTRPRPSRPGSIFKSAASAPRASNDSSLASRRWIAIGFSSRPAAAEPAARMLETIGVLARSSQGGNPFDRFRGRGLFPIRDAQGRPVGMGGRLLPGVEINSPAKYINSPETPLYRKSHLLYGLDLAKEAFTRAAEDGPGDGGLYRRHHRPSVRLSTMPWPCSAWPWARRTSRILKRVRRSHRAGARRRRGGAKAGRTKCWNCSSPSKSICEFSRCPTISIRANSFSSAGPKHSPNCSRRARSTRSSMRSVGHARHRYRARRPRVEPGIGAVDRDIGQGAAIAVRHVGRWSAARRKVLAAYCRHVPRERERKSAGG